MSFTELTSALTKWLTPESGFQKKLAEPDFMEDNKQGYKSAAKVVLANLNTVFNLNLS